MGDIRMINVVINGYGCIGCNVLCVFYELV